jgi:hypothetical protein
VHPVTSTPSQKPGDVGGVTEQRSAAARAVGNRFESLSSDDDDDDPQESAAETQSSRMLLVCDEWPQLVCAVQSALVEKVAQLASAPKVAARTFAQAEAAGRARAAAAKVVQAVQAGASAAPVSGSGTVTVASLAGAPAVAAVSSGGNSVGSIAVAQAPPAAAAAALSMPRPVTVHVAPAMQMRAHKSRPAMAMEKLDVLLADNSWGWDTMASVCCSGNRALFVFDASAQLCR